MTALFGLPLLLGFVLMVIWIAATAVAGQVEGWEGVSPEERFGRTGRYVLAGTIGFGMAGISALYAGWPDVLSVVAGLAGAVGLIVTSTVLGPETGS